MRIYVAGPCSGIPEYNYPAFFEAARQLRAAGYEVVSPAEICSPELDWNGCMRVCIAALVTCDAVALLPGWQRSKGATIEANLAESLGMPRDAVYGWLMQDRRVL